MKNLMLFLIGIFSFSFFMSCGDEKFDPYTNEDYDKSKGLIPLESVHIHTDPITGLTSTSKNQFEYDNKNRIRRIISSEGSTQIIKSISYNENNGTIDQVIIDIPAVSKHIYTYEYLGDNKVMEHQTINGVDSPSNTLYFTGNYSRLSSKEDPLGNITRYVYDTKGNLTRSGTNTYTYDDSIGVMSKVKTPYWIFFLLEGEIPFTHNLVNNVIVDNGNNYYVYSNPTYSNFPQTIDIGTGETISIQYMLAR